MKNLIPKHGILRSLLFFLVAALPFTLVCGAIFWWVFHWQLQYQSNLEEVAHWFNITLFIFLFMILALQALFITWLTRHLIGPLNQIIADVSEASEQLTGKSQVSYQNTKLGRQKSKEWTELTRNIGQIVRQANQERKRYQQESDRIKALLASVPNPIIAVDKELNLLFANNLLEDVTRAVSLKPKETALADVFSQRIIQEHFQDAINTNEPQLFECQLDIYHGGRQPVMHYFLVRIQPLYKSYRKEENRGAIGVFHDISELKKAELIRTEFVANVSHELRTPLTSVQGYVSTLEEDVEHKSYDFLPKYTEIIRRNTDHLKELVDELLELARLDAGVDLNKTEIDLELFTERVLESLRVKSAAKSQDLQATYKTERLVADPKLLEQVLMNLVDNAIKYTPEGTSIHLDWYEEDFQVVLKVKDKGQGISQEHLGRLFERFYRVDKSRSSESGGTGLGLAIVKHIMIAHGGEVRVSSEMGQGTEFHCFFPEY